MDAHATSWRRLQTWSRHLPVATKLSLRLVLVLALLGGAATIAIFTGTRQVARFRDVARVDVPLLRAASEIEINANEAAAALLLYLDIGDTAAFARHHNDRLELKQHLDRYRNATTTSPVGARRMTVLVSGFDSVAGEAITAAQRQRRLLSELADAQSSLHVLLAARDRATSAVSSTGLRDAREALLRHAGSTWEFVAAEDPAVLGRIDTEAARYRAATAAHATAAARLSVQRDIRLLEDRYFALAGEVVDVQRAQRARLTEIGRVRRSLDELLDQIVQAPVEQRLDAFVGDLGRVRRTQVGITLGALLIALALAAVAAERLALEINSPLAELVSVSDRMSAGDLDQRVKMDASREFNVLGRAFNRMADSLRESEDRRSRALMRARSASAAKSRFVADVSHEMRTPLTSLRGSLILLANRAVDPASASGHRLLQVAIGSTDRLIRMINDRLDLDKIEAQQSGSELVEVDLASVVSDGLAEVGTLALAKEIAFDVTGSAPPAWGNPDALVQVVVNLVGNAIKFSPAGSTVRVSMSAVRDRARVSISDEGPGIAETDAERVFGRFEQLGAGDSATGTGLGLAIARSIVQDHGGDIGVESERGAGATFWFTVPLKGADS